MYFRQADPDIWMLHAVFDRPRHCLVYIYIAPGWSFSAKYFHQFLTQSSALFCSDGRVRVADVLACGISHTHSGRHARDTKLRRLLLLSLNAVVRAPVY